MKEKVCEDMSMPQSHMQKDKTHFNKPQLIVKHDPSVQNKERFTVHFLTRQQEAKQAATGTSETGRLLMWGRFVKSTHELKIRRVASGNYKTLHSQRRR